MIWFEWFALLYFALYLPENITVKIKLNPLYCRMQTNSLQQSKLLKPNLKAPTPLNDKMQSLNPNCHLKFEFRKLEYTICVYSQLRYYTEKGTIGFFWLVAYGPIT